MDTKKNSLEIVYRNEVDFPKTHFYKINNKKDIQLLEKKCRIRFIADKKNPPPVFIAPVAVLPINTYGVYAAQNLTMKNKNRQGEVTLGRYLGERIPKAKISKTKNYHYGFQTLITGESEEEHDYEMLDGQHVRNWAVFVNHSPVVNVQCEVKRFRGKKDIFLSYRKKIKKHHQLLISYGKDYFVDKKHKQLYLHETDNWETPAQKYQQYADEYLSTPQKLSQIYVKAFGFSADDYFVIPKITDAILNQDSKEVFNLIKKRLHVETLIYRLKRKSSKSNQCYFIETSKQQQISPLMAACFKGDEKIIKALLKKDADVTRFSLNDGNGCLHFLLLGHANNNTKLKVGQLLIKKGAPLTVQNQNHQSILDLCFEQNLEQLATAILQSKEQAEILYFLLEEYDRRAPCILLRAFEKKWFKLLKIILTQAEIEPIQAYLKAHKSFLNAIKNSKEFNKICQNILQKKA